MSTQTSGRSPRGWRRRPITAALALFILLATSGTAAAQADFAAAFRTAGIANYRNGHYPEAVRDYRIARFASLEDPAVYEEILARLALAEDAAKQAPERDATLDRFFSTETKFGAFAASSLEPDLEERFRGLVTKRYPRERILAVETLAAEFGFIPERPTKKPTPSPAPTEVPEVTGTAVPFPAETPTPALSPTEPPSPAPTATAAPSRTPTVPPPTATLAPTETATAMPTRTSTSPPTPTRTPSRTPSPSETSTATATATSPPTRTASPTRTVTPSSTASATRSATASRTPSSTRTSTPTSTATPTPSSTSTATRTLTPSPRPTSTATRTPSSSPTKTATRTLTFSPSSTSTATRTPSSSPTATATSTSTSTPTHTPAPTSTIPRSATRTATATRVPPTWTPHPPPTRTPSPGPAPFVASKSLDSPPRPIERIMPVYPEHALRERIRGLVILRVTVSELGAPTEVAVVKGARADLTEAAVEAARQWRFEPGRKGGRAVRTSVTLQFPFEGVQFARTPLSLEPEAPSVSPSPTP